MTQLTSEGLFNTIPVTNSESLNLDDEYTETDFKESLAYCIAENLVKLSEDNTLNEGYSILYVTEKGQQFLQEHI